MQPLLRPAAILLVATSVLSACNSGGVTPLQSAGCTTVACLNDEIKLDLQRQCVRDLFWFERRSRQRQAAIQAEYAYPLTSWQTYNDWMRLGNGGPAPGTWCRQYADAKVEHYYRTLPGG